MFDYNTWLDVVVITSKLTNIIEWNIKMAIFSLLLAIIYKSFKVIVKLGTNKGRLK